MGRLADFSKALGARPSASAVQPLFGIGHVVPDFHAETTMGPISFADWAANGWTVLFIHPLAATPVCTSEMISLIKNERRFAELNTKVLGLNSSDLRGQQGWHQDCETVFGKKVWFPCVANLDPALLARLGTDVLEGRAVLPRKTIILDPARRVRLVLEYPLNFGRNIEDILRCIEAMQIADRCGVMVPADWQSGDPFVTMADAAAPVSDEDGDVTVLPYLTIVADPEARSKSVSGAVLSRPDAPTAS